MEVPDVAKQQGNLHEALPGYLGGGVGNGFAWKVESLPREVTGATAVANIALPEMSSRRWPTLADEAGQARGVYEEDAPRQPWQPKPVGGEEIPVEESIGRCQEESLLAGMFGPGSQGFPV